MSNELPPPATHAEFWERVRCLCALHHCSVTSGARTDSRNVKVGGVPTSWHRIERGGLGADLVPDSNTHTVRANLMIDARRLGFRALDEDDHVHLQPEN